MEWPKELKWTTNGEHKGMKVGDFFYSEWRDPKFPEKPWHWLLRLFGFSTPGCVTYRFRVTEVTDNSVTAWPEKRVG
jgi:hypothetical protein